MALQFYATGQLLNSNGDMLNIHNKATASRVVHKVSAVPARRMDEFIVFAAGADLRSTQTTFIGNFGFQKWLGQLMELT